MSEDDATLFPARCVLGDAPFLVDRTVAPESTGFSCPTCGAEALLIPGAIYTGLTRARFDAVAGALHAANLTPSAAADYADGLGRVVGLRTPDAVRAASRRLASVGLSERDMPKAHNDRVAFVALVRTLLEVYASGPRTSGVEPTLSRGAIPAGDPQTGTSK